MLPPKNVQEAVDKLISEHGIAAAAKLLGMSDESALRLAKSQPVRLMTVSLAKERLHRLGRAVADEKE